MAILTDQNHLMAAAPFLSLNSWPDRKIEHLDHQTIEVKKLK